MLSVHSNCSQTHMAYLLFGGIINCLSSGGAIISASRISFTALICETLATRIAFDTSKLDYAFETNLVFAITERRVTGGCRVIFR